MARTLRKERMGLQEPCWCPCGSVATYPPVRLAQWGRRGVEGAVIGPGICVVFSGLTATSPRMPVEGGTWWVLSAIPSFQVLPLPEAPRACSTLPCGGVASCSAWGCRWLWTMTRCTGADVVCAGDFIDTSSFEATFSLSGGFIGLWVGRPSVGLRSIDHRLVERNSCMRLVVVCENNQHSFYLPYSAPKVSQDHLASSSAA